MEATILRWVKQVGDTVEAEETILEIATDKVDSEVPSPVDGKIVKLLFEENETVPIGKAIAIIESEVGSENVPGSSATPGPEESKKVEQLSAVPVQMAEDKAVPTTSISSSPERFYSPLVKNIARQENVSQKELDAIPGSGMKGRVTKQDLLAYLDQRQQGGGVVQKAPAPKVDAAPVFAQNFSGAAVNGGSVNGQNEIIEMDRMRKLIAEHMVRSKRTSPHVTSFVEADVTNIVNWRNRVKGDFQKKFGQKITFTPIFIEAVVRTIRDFPMINVSVDGEKIILKKSINIGMATALPSGNLIVPVIKQADHLSLVGLTQQVNDLANRARTNALKPAEIQGGTFTLTNVGTFGNVMGTPIINQPQVAILATGAIKKKPAVVETEFGDVIAIRQLMFLSLSYDHRVVDGVLGGSFVRRVADYLEAFDPKRGI